MRRDLHPGEPGPVERGHPEAPGDRGQGHQLGKHPGRESVRAPQLDVGQRRGALRARERSSGTVAAGVGENPYIRTS